MGGGVIKPIKILPNMKMTIDTNLQSNSNNSSNNTTPNNGNGGFTEKLDSIIPKPKKSRDFSNSYSM